MAEASTMMQMVFFVMNVFVMTSAVPALLPLVVPGAIKLQSYRACVLASAAANVGREVVKMPGLPSPLTSLDAWRVWFGT